MKQKLIPIISVVVGIIAFMLTYQYLQSKLADIKAQRDKLYAGARQISVVVPTHDIPKGSAITKNDIGSRSISATTGSDRFVSSDEAGMLLGKKVTQQLVVGSPILWVEIEGGTPALQGLSSIIQHGMRAISISVGGASAVSAMVAPNDHVDVLGTFSFPSKTSAGDMETVTITVLQDVTVLATGQTMAKQASLRDRSADRSANYSTVTLEVTAREAELLVFAQQMQGRLTLSLRNSTDGTYEKNLPEVDFKYLESQLPELNKYRQQQIRKKLGF